jgi:type VI secretion system secreted protein Hcp
MPIYMQYGDIKGDVTAEGHKEWVEVGSFQWGVGRGISSPVGGSKDRESSAPSVSEITVTKTQDIASPKLLEAACVGEGVKVKLDFTKTDKGKLETYIEVTLEECMISGFSMSSGGDRPIETLSLNFTKIEYRFTPMGTDGKPGSPETFKYDLGEAKSA